MFFTQVLLKLQNLGHFSGIKQMHFLETCCNPTLPILHRMQASRSRKTSWIQGGRIQDSRSRKRRLDPRSLFALNLESKETGSTKLVLRVESWIQVRRALSATINCNFLNAQLFCEGHVLWDFVVLQPFNTIILSKNKSNVSFCIFKDVKTKKQKTSKNWGNTNKDNAWSPGQTFSVQFFLFSRGFVVIHIHIL